MPAPSLEFFATCSQGFEPLLSSELKHLGTQRVRALTGGVAFFGDQALGYRVCLWSRLASRITRIVARVSAKSAQDLYAGVKEIPWERFVGEQATISVFARGTNEALRNTQFSAQKVKDALCDHLREVRGYRPDVSPHRAAVPLWITIHKNKATISLDYSGESLHRRGYRMPGEQVEAPIKETLAAALLIWAGWERICAPHHHATKPQTHSTSNALPLFDPACGSGTLVLEAAMMAADRAPGLSRDYWGFAGHADFNAEAWAALLLEADERFERGLDKLPRMVGADIDSRAIQIAQGNARRLGLASRVCFRQANVTNLEQTLSATGIDSQLPGFLVCNPPYGHRLLPSDLAAFYRSLKQGISSLSPKWQMAIITSDDTFDFALGLKAENELAVYNGSIPATFRHFSLEHSLLPEFIITTISGKERPVRLYSDHALQFAARLRKMAKTRRRWARKNDIFAYRVYDADLPDYSLSLDWFSEAKTGVAYALVAEYSAPKEIDPTLARQRFSDACNIIRTLFELDQDHLFVRVRTQARGGSQYAQAAHLRTQTARRPTRLYVEEAEHTFELDLSSYLDTGLFLDHRPTRSLLERLAADTSFLNLFAYTGTASVYAAAGGARKTTTVDMSQTYLDWAKRNMSLNGFHGKNHHFVREDALSWVKQAAKKGQRYDLVFVDPPTFSNSKTMGKRTWDIQRDHKAFLSDVRKLLSPGATVVFSGNLRSFHLDEQGVAGLGFTIENITAQSIPEDFSRNPRIHFCYLLKLPSTNERPY